MKWVVLATIVTFLLLLCVRALQHLTRGQATIHLAHMKSRDDALQVAKVLKGLQGVVEVRVDPEGHVARIRYRKSTITIEQIMTALHAAGF